MPFILHSDLLYPPNHGTATSRPLSSYLIYFPSRYLGIMISNWHTIKNRLLAEKNKSTAPVYNHSIFFASSYYVLEKVTRSPHLSSLHWARSVCLFIGGKRLWSLMYQPAVLLSLIPNMSWDQDGWLECHKEAGHVMASQCNWAVDCYQSYVYGIG